MSESAAGSDRDDDPARWAIAEDLSATLELEPIDRDLFRAVHSVDARTRHALYGGQVAAQALRAAGLTVGDDRYPHSLHGYFLRPGRPERAVILRVHRDRDGGSFSARHVAAVQDGEVIFSMLASFHRDEPSATYDPEPGPDVPAPTALAPQAGHDRLLDIREVTATRAEGAKMVVADRMWLKAAQPLPDDRLVHACALTYISDMGSGFGQVDRPGLATAGPSIDHTIWFHEPLRIDDWVLLELRPSKARGARGVYQGTVRDRHGRMGAMLSQEMLLRQPAG